jgi:hypothetical protein
MVVVVMVKMVMKIIFFSLNSFIPQYLISKN